MDGADLDPRAYGYIDDDDVLMAEEARSATDESVDEEENHPYLNPPTHGYPDDGERPPFVLIEPDAYFADRHNATTASCDMEDLGGTLSVTFCVAHPPLVSYLCVHATAFDHTDFAVEPHIIAAETDGGLVLLRLVIETWSKVPVVIKSYPSHVTCKTLTIGGDKGTVAWVDLWHNILLCDVLDKRPTLRTLELPTPIMPTKALGFGHPGSVRDIAVLGGFIKYVELHSCPVKQGLLGDSSSPFHTWKAAVWSIKAGSSSSKDWHMDYLLDSTEIPESSLPNLRVEEDAVQPTLSSLHIGLPNLSLQDDDIVYFLTKIDYRDNSNIAWVIAVDMRNKTFQKVREFSSMRTLGLTKGYVASRISKHLKGAPELFL